MLGFLIDDIFACLMGGFFNRQYSYGYQLCSSSLRLIPVWQTSRLLQKNGKKLDRSFNFTLRYINDANSLHNSKFGESIYPIELEIKDTTDTARSLTYTSKLIVRVG